MEIVLSCDFVDTTISSGAHSLSLFRFPLLSYDFLLFRLYLSLSIFTHCTSSDTAFHFPCSFSFSQKCRGESPLLWGPGPLPTVPLRPMVCSQGKARSLPRGRFPARQSR